MLTRLVIFFFFSNAQIDNSITSLDIDPAGRLIATVDAYGLWLILEINSDSWKFHLQIGNNAGIRSFPVSVMLSPVYR